MTAELRKNDRYNAADRPEPHRSALRQPDIGRGRSAEELPCEQGEETTMRPHPLLGGALLTVAFIGAAATASAQQAPTGADEFQNSCAVCHGEDARGGGPLAKVLTVKPADLTQLSKRNDGVFPIEKVTETIDGRTQIAGHGTRAMPVWGTRYEAEVGRRYGPYGSESAVKTRIYVLVRYLQSIQEK
jgi:mono/diheme cytochrome c family protein